LIGNIVVLEAASILGAYGNTYAQELPEDGAVIIIAPHLEQVSTDAGFLHFQLQGKDIRLPSSTLSSCGIFFELQRLRKSTVTNQKVWDAVFRSSRIKDAADHMWDEAFLEVNAICGGDRKQRFQIAICSFQKNKEHKVLCTLRMSLNSVLKSAKSGRERNLKKSDRVCGSLTGCFEGCHP
jgi:hypothetical protein